MFVSTQTGSDTHFEALWFDDGFGGIGSAVYDRLRWIESGAGDADAHAAAGSSLFSGQVWLFTSVAEGIAPGFGESPMRYALTSRFQGEDRALSVYEGGTTLRVQDVSETSDTSWFGRVDVTSSNACESDDDCGGFARWSQWGVCLTRCAATEPFCAVGNVCDVGLCVAG
jgi:hypothetical protein